jgi:hypothetical protein
VVYLLRVRAPQNGETLDAAPHGSATREVEKAWRAWARTVRESGGAVVLAVQTTRPPVRQTHGQTQTRPTMRGARLVSTEVRERAAVSADNIRTLTLHAGQFINAGPDERLPC